MAETKKRSIVKTISWRTLATIDTTIIVYILTRNLTISLTAGGIEVFTKMVLYYLHERGWAKVRWGRDSA